MLLKNNKKACSKLSNNDAYYLFIVFLVDYFYTNLAPALAVRHGLQWVQDNLCQSQRQ